MSERNTILVVDDQTNVRNILEFNLKRKGFDILSAQDGLAAITLAINNQPDLMLLDIMMPGIDGFQVLEKLRSDERTSSIPVLVVSAKGTEDDILQAMKLGAKDYIVKPFNLDQLMQKAFKLIQQSGTKREPEKIEEPKNKSSWPIVSTVLIGKEYPNQKDEELLRQIQRLFETGSTLILLDFSLTGEISTLSFGKLARLQQIAKKNEIEIKFITKTEEHLNTLKESNFAKHFEIYPDWVQALKEFGL